ncbi:hypothetical protein CLV24_103165 [Pontibacter ummariensis]|uniref:Uncharacterized protein n=2 Tax=Pontibacter ummariensis TaxID=1610492 RepID=A0A239CMS5_9BACT|nr:hypothetical protein CLV24_103165 [Pontibacter ummariensis]SNS21430.1 hypothetical protein SAMN06296052_103148 [Pontibacter ummariensis]
MENLWRRIQEYMPIVALVLLSILIMPAALANGNNNGNSATVSASATPQVSPLATEDTKASKATPATKVAPKPKEKSVLDAEVLESPMEYFKKAFSSDEEGGADTAPNSGAAMMTVKALVAMLLSTII